MTDKSDVGGPADRGPGDGAAIIRREWAMPSAATFDVPPIAALLDRWLDGRAVVVDPFSRNSRRGTHRNDIDMSTNAESHMEASSYMLRLCREGIRADAVLLDPPYSPRQISEHYKASGLTPTRETTQTGGLYRRARAAADRLLRVGGVVISFGWNSAGMSEASGYVLREILLVAHGGAHNDTIVVVDEKVQAHLSLEGTAIPQESPSTTGNESGNP